MTKKIISVVLAICMVLSMAVVAGLTVSATEGTVFYVVGEVALCGANWNVNYEGNQMTLNASTGLYEKTFENVASGTYQFKVTQGDWNLPNWGSPALDNYYHQVDSACDVTVQFNPATEEITCVGEGVGTYQMNIDGPVYVAGNGEDGTDWLNGVDWAGDPWVEDNEMTEVEDGVYEITFDGYI